MPYGSDNKIERVTFTIGWGEHEGDRNLERSAPGDRLSYFTSPEIREAVTARTRWSYERLELETASARPPRGSYWQGKLWEMNGSLESTAYIERTAKGITQPYFIEDEQRDKMQMRDITYIESCRAAEQLEDEYPGISHYYRTSGSATKALQQGGGWTIDEVERPPTHDEMEEKWKSDLANRQAASQSNSTRHRDRASHPSPGDGRGRF